MNNKKAEKGISAFSASVFLSISVCFLLFIFAPVEEYITNIDEFSYDIFDLLKMMLPAFAAVSAVLILFFFLVNKLSKKVCFLALILMFVAFLATYVQGTFFSKRLPPLDGSAIDWSQFDYQRIQSIVIWSVAILAVIILAVLLKNGRFCKLVKTVAVISLAFFFVSLVSVCIAGNGLMKKEDYVVTTDGITELSNDKNFIVLLVDAVDADTFQEITEKDSKYDGLFDDFTFYKNTVGAYPYTTHCIPFILSGKWFENEQYTYKYLADAYENSAFLKELEKRDYSIGIYDEETALTDDSFERFENIKKIDRNVFKLPRDFYVLQIKMTGLKYFPYDLKKYCTFTPYYVYNSSKKVLNSGSIFEPDNLSFYNLIRNNSIETVSGKNCFRFIHVDGAHVPFQYDENLNITDTADYESSVKASLTLTEAFLSRLRESGMYDNSVIIIMADHGYNDIWTYGRQNPILLIKGTDEHHAYEISDAPISFVDLQDAYLRLLDGEMGSNAFPWKEGDARDRRYLFYYYNEEDTIWEYIQSGHADDLDTMYETGNVYTHPIL